VGTSILTQDTAADWGAGNGTNTDITTYPGSVALTPLAGGYNPFVVSTFTYLPIGYTLSQPFYVNNNLSVNYIATSGCLYTSGGIKFGTFYVAIATASVGGILYQGSFPASTNGSAGWVENGASLSSININLWAGTTYYYQMYGTGGDNRAFANVQPPTYASVQLLGNIFNASASYTTQAINAGSSWSTWLSINNEATVPVGSSINYYAVTSTSIYNLSSNASIPLSTNGPISSSVGPYIQIISSFSRTDATVVPMLNKITIMTLETDNKRPRRQGLRWKIPSVRQHR